MDADKSSLDATHANLAGPHNRREAEIVCRSIYRETADFYADHQALISPGNLGFRILYGPPTIQAPILFIGYQPGGRAIEDSGHHVDWPVECDYAQATWLLARRIRDIWGAELVANCTGTNAIFFRAPTVRDWKQLDRAAVKEAENFSLERAKKIAVALRPRNIVIIGLGTFNMFASGSEIALSSGPKVLAKRGRLWGMPATGIIHLSGERVSRVELDHLRSFFRENSN